MSLDGDVGNAFEVLRVGRDDDVYVLRSPDDPPRVYSEAADQNELDLSFGKAAKELIESRFGQLLRAAPVNRIN